MLQMDNIELNNQVVCMRKFVKQAKLRVMNKLVKTHKNLLEKKGTDEQIAKNERKGEKLLSEIEIVKKLNVDSVSKMALLKEKDWQSVLDNKSSTSEERALALVANFESVVKEVNRFHEEKPHLIAIFPNVIKQWVINKNNPFRSRSQKTGKLLKNKQYKQEHMKFSANFEKNYNIYAQNKSMEAKFGTDLDVDVQNKSMEAESGKDLGTNAQNKSMEAKIGKNLDTVAQNKSMEAESGKDLETNAQNKSMKTKIGEDLDTVVQNKSMEAESGKDLDTVAQNKSIQVKNIKKAEPKKKNPECKIVALDLSKQEGELSFQPDSLPEESDLSSSKEKKLQIIKDDPFFGEVKSFQDKEQGFGLEKFWKNERFSQRYPSSNRGQRLPYSSRGSFTRGSSNKFENQTQPYEKKQDRYSQSYSNNTQHSSKPFSHEKKGNSFSKEDISKDKEPALHPSWAAKKKLVKQCAILPSQAKRIKFDS